MKPSVDSRNRLDIAKGKISEPEDMSIEMSQTEMQRTKMGKKKSGMSRKVSLDNLEEMDKFTKTTYQY